MINEKMLNILACPNCKSKIIYKHNINKLYCPVCDIFFDIIDNIPLMTLNNKEQ